MNDEQVDGLIRAVRAIAHGNTNAPSGLEMLAMAVGGRDGSVAESLDGIAHSIDRLAHAVVQLAGVIDHHGASAALRSGKDR